MEKTKSSTEPSPQRKEEKFQAIQSPFEEFVPGLRPNDTDAYLVRLLSAMREKGLTEQEALLRIRSQSLAKHDEGRLGRLAKQVFSGMPDDEAPSPTLPKAAVGVAAQNEFMERRYLFRHNEVTGITEYIQRGKYELDFRPVTERTLNSIAINALEEGIDMWDRDVKRYLNSDRVSNYNPFDDFFGTLPKWDKRPRIDKFFRRVPTADEAWYGRAHTWFLGMVALWKGVNRRHGNETILILVGPQGTHKSTFCRSIVPPELAPYYTENFSLADRRRAMLMLTRYGLINFDEINRITERQQPVLKNILQLPVIDEVRPYGSTSRQERRYASFVGTSNETDIITDLTGSRRYLCTSVTGAIDTSKPVNYPMLYAEAVYELEQGRPCWLSEADERALAETNVQFMRLPPIAERIDALFTPGTEGDKDSRWLYATEIYSLIYPTIHTELTKKQLHDLSTIMQQRKIPSKRGNGGRKYLLKRRRNAENV